MAGSGRWNFHEEESYGLCVAQLGGAKYVDRVLGMLLNALSLNPYGFYPTGVANIRIAKTHLILQAGEIIPALTLRYRIEPPATVALLHLEVSMPEDMEF